MEVDAGKLKQSTTACFSSKMQNATVCCNMLQYALSRIQLQASVKADGIAERNFRELVARLLYDFFSCNFVRGAMKKHKHDTIPVKSAFDKVIERVSQPAVIMVVKHIINPGINDVIAL